MGKLRFAGCTWIGLCPTGQRDYRITATHFWGIDGRSVAFGAFLSGGRTPSQRCVDGGSDPDVRTNRRIVSLPWVSTNSSVCPCVVSVFLRHHGVCGVIDIGDRKNSARSLRPTKYIWTMGGCWMYWIGPPIGVLAGVAVFRFLAKWIEVQNCFISQAIVVDGFLQ